MAQALAELEELEELVATLQAEEVVDQVVAAEEQEDFLTLVQREHMAVELVEQAITSAPLGLLPTAQSALSVSSGVMAVAIRRTPQTSN